MGRRAERHGTERKTGCRDLIQNLSGSLECYDEVRWKRAKLDGGSGSVRKPVRRGRLDQNGVVGGAGFLFHPAQMAYT